MSRPKQRLLAFLHYQRYFGLSDLHFSEPRTTYWLRGSWTSYVTQILTNLILVAALAATLSESIYYMETGTQTGNLFDTVVILGTSITQLLGNLWFRGHQNEQLALLQRLLQLKMQVPTKSLLHLRVLYRIWLSVCLYYAILVCNFAVTFWLTEMQLSHIFTLLGFAIRTLQATFLFTCYSGMVCTMQGLLRSQAEQLDDLMASCLIERTDLARSLKSHDLILLLCQKDLVEVYGGTLVFLLLNQVMHSVLIFYITTLDRFRSITELFVILGWLAPMIFYLILPLAINDVFNQVSGLLNFTNLSQQ